MDGKLNISSLRLLEVIGDVDTRVKEKKGISEKVQSILKSRDRGDLETC
jgi:hypothetical protein